jgi:hypothetical protein
MIGDDNIPETVLLGVNGTLMRGLELNSNLLDVGAIFASEAKTQQCYRLWSINDQYPAMQKVNSEGNSISLEVWEVPVEGLAQLLLNEPSGLCIGKIDLANGDSILGVLGESICCDLGMEITHWGGWREYIESKSVVRM